MTALHSLLSPLYSAFWGLYGRYAWDDQREPSGSLETPESIADILRRRRSGTDEWVLDAGCGTGNFAVALARAGFHVVGIDFASGMLAKAREKVNGELADILSSQRADLSLPLLFPIDHFDHIVCISVLQVASRPASTLREFHRVLKPGGTLVLSLPEQNAALMTQSVWQIIRDRVGRLDGRTPAKMLLVVIKTFADRYGGAKRWTPAQAEEMLTSNGFGILSLSEGRQILAVAEKVHGQDVGGVQRAAANAGSS